MIPPPRTLGSSTALAILGTVILALALDPLPAYFYCGSENADPAIFVHLRWNAVWQWRPLLTNIVQQCAGSPLRALLLYGALGVVGGIALALSSAHGASTLARGVWAAACGMFALQLLLLIFGIDLSLVIAFGLAPWLLLAMKRSQESDSWSWILVAALLSSAAAYELGPLAPLLIFVLFLFAQPRTGTSRGRILALCVIIPALCGALLEAPLPWQYPTSAHLVPDDGVAGIARPLIGPDTPVPYLSRVDLKNALGPVGLALALFAFALSCVRRFRTETGHGVLVRGAVLLALIVAWDLLLPERWSEIGPLAALERLVPGLQPLGAAPLATGVLLIVCLGLAAIQSPVAILVLPALILASATVGGGKGFSEWRRGLVLLPSTWEKINAIERAVHDNGSSLSREMLERWLRSPSLYLAVRADPAAVLAEHSAPPDRLRRLRAEYRASANTEHLSALTDRDPTTRWWAGHDGQHGEEWIALRLQEEHGVRGIQLDLGGFATDFPGGVRISTQDDCSLDTFPELDSGKRHIVFESPKWEGPIRYTPEGLPYLGSPSEVFLRFSNIDRDRCYLIEQIGSRAHFDWSIAELRFETTGGE